MAASASRPGWPLSFCRYPRKRPPSPCVAVTTNTSTPSDAYFASVPPIPSDSSSGWASTAISRRRCRGVIMAPLPRNHGLQTLCRNDQAFVAAAVRGAQQCHQLGFERVLPLFVEREERLVYRSVECPEHL